MYLTDGGKLLNEQRAREVIEAMKARYPDAPELERFP
jgi:hypothetical protein